MVKQPYYKISEEWRCNNTKLQKYMKHGKVIIPEHHNMTYFDQFMNAQSKETVHAVCVLGIPPDFTAPTAVRTMMKSRNKGHISKY